GRGALPCLPCWRRNSIASTPSLAQCRFEYTLPSLSASLVRRTSARLSSTSRISTGGAARVLSPIGFVPLLGKREMEGAAAGGLPLRPGTDPDAAAVAVDDFLADREADAGARVLALVVQALEHHEDALEVLRLDADAVVPDRYFEFFPARRAGDVDAR